MTVGLRIKTAREAAGLRQKDLAAKLGVEPLTVSRWERDEGGMTIQRLYDLAAALDVPASTLLFDNRTDGAAA